MIQLLELEEDHNNGEENEEDFWLIRKVLSNSNVNPKGVLDLNDQAWKARGSRD